jgi:hypothetical protein
MSKLISVGEKTIEVEGMMIPINEMVPNPKQPRVSRILSAELRKSILETKGLVQPLLVERVNESQKKSLLKEVKQRYQEFGDTCILDFLESVDPKFLILDGERRWANIVRMISEDPSAEYLKIVPCDVVKQQLSEKDRYILWVSIHRMRKEWMAMEKENAAMALVKLVGDLASAANILGVTVRQLSKFIEIYNLSQRMIKAVGPRAISYAREIMNLAAKLRTEEVVNAIIDKVNRGLIKDSVDIRQLRVILNNPEAREEFLKPNGTIASALSKIQQWEVKPSIGKSAEFRDTLMQFKSIVSNYPWREIRRWKGNKELLEEIEDCIRFLQEIKETLAA